MKKIKAKDLEILRKKAEQITFLLLDVDGIMTDGKIIIDGQGNEFKAFHIHDGHGIYLLKSAGIDVGIISGRSAKAVESRARELHITEVHQDVKDKIRVYETIKATHRLSDHQVAFMGDDLIDIPLLQRVGFSATAADAVKSVRDTVDVITENKGGEGAVREVIDFILMAKSR